MQPVILLVAHDDAGRRAIHEEMASRYRRDYELMVVPSIDDGVAELRGRGPAASRLAMAMVRDDHPDGQTPGEALSHIRAIVPTAKRIALIPREKADRAVFHSRTDVATGLVDTRLIQPDGPRDEDFHTVVSDYLSDWAAIADTPVVEVVRIVGIQEDPAVRSIVRLLDRQGIPSGTYPPRHPAVADITAAVGADAPLPILRDFDGSVWVRPTLAQVADAIGLSADLVDGEVVDVAVVGSGPAGLGAAVYAASEGLSAVVLEADAVGGQAGTSSMIRNYLGFPRGISGQRLGRRGFQQAARFGARFHVARSAVGLTPGAPHVVQLSDGTSLPARAVLLASGAAYRRLGVPAIEALVGAGVNYGAPMSEARAMVGGHAVVVGGGNSAGQAAIHLARFAARVSIVVRRDGLAATMSDYLIREIDAHDRITVLTESAVVDGGGAGRLEHVVIRSAATGDSVVEACAGLFLLLGADPCADWLPPSLARDESGFVLTGADIPSRSWHPDRAPAPLETSIPGVFAAGDVRAGSVKRVAAAAGEGAVAVPMIHAWLASQDA
jgi:thioredoxin reductase (NADPH)